MKIEKVKRESFLDVDTFGSRVRVTVATPHLNVGMINASFTMSKKETTELIRVLKSQRGRKGVR